ncbi:MAG TPA: hypothetical protein VFX70_20835 [Mycobacteriales bacterium]|nr:hypothetical protein [Mycobacteriales bacterium]
MTGSRRHRPACEEDQQAWRATALLYNHLTRGGCPQPYRPADALVLAEGESCYADTVLGYARYYGIDPAVAPAPALMVGPAGLIATSLVVSAWHTRRARRRAHARAKPAWRDTHPARTVLTDQRTLCNPGDGAWIDLSHDQLLGLHAWPDDHALVATYTHTAPLRLTGPWTPWYALTWAALVYPRDRLLPEFAHLA